LWPEVRPLLERHGFAVAAHEPREPRVVIVEATLR
jgi:hypothetical protein